MIQIDKIFQQDKNSIIELTAMALNLTWKCNNCGIKDFCIKKHRNDACLNVIRDFLRSEVEDNDTV